MRKDPLRLQSWLKELHDEIVHKWRAEIREREDRRREEGDGLLELFLDSLLRVLPACLGDQRDTGEEVWEQATHLYGSLALQRGLAAGEVVEELQLLREVVLRLLLESSPGEMEDRGFQRDFLTLNRVLDLGVVRASVSYVDDLFFAHLQGSGVPESVTPDIEEEMRRQLEAFQRDIGGPESNTISRRGLNGQE